MPYMPSPVKPRPCASNRNRPTTQSQSPTHPPKPSPAMTTEPQSTPVSSSALQLALDMMTSMARFVQRVASAALPTRDHGTPPETPRQFVSGTGCDPARSRLPSSPPPRGGGVPARPPDEPPQEGKAPTTPSCSPPVYLFSSMDVADGVPMTLPNDAPGSKPAHYSLPSCVSTDKIWLDDETHGTRRS
jgi:hypothetical protein